MSGLGFVTGMKAEAACLGRAFGRCAGAGLPRVACAGGDGERARLAALDLVAAGAEALISFGVAGGLDPALASGRIVLADAVVPPAGGRFATDGAWRARLGERLEGDLTPVVGAIAGSTEAVVSPADKAALGLATGALAVDMESHGVATAAAAAGVPLLVVRAIADPADRAVPPELLAGLSPDGGRRPLAALAALARRPGRTAAAMHLARDSARALASLRRLAAALAPDFAFV